MLYQKILILSFVLIEILPFSDSLIPPSADPAIIPSHPPSPVPPPVSQYYSYSPLHAFLQQVMLTT